MSNQPSTSGFHNWDHRRDESFESSSEDGELVRMDTPTGEIPEKNSPESKAPSKKNRIAKNNRIRWDNESDDSDEEEEEFEPISSSVMSNQPSTSGFHNWDHRWDQDSDSDYDDDDDPGTATTSKKETSTKTKSRSYPSAPGEESDESGSDKDEVVTKRRPPIRRIREKKLQARSRGGRFVKKTTVIASTNGSSIRSDSESEEEEEMAPPKKKKVKVENKSKNITDEQVKERNRQRNMARKKKEQWDAAEKAQAARDTERTSSTKQGRPLNRYIQSRPPPQEPDSAEQATVPPPAPTAEELAARLAKNKERRRLYQEGKAKDEEMRAKKCETERIRRFAPRIDAGTGTMRAAPSTRAVDRSGVTTVWELRRFVRYEDKEKKAKEWKRKVNKTQIRPLKPRTGPAANNGVYAIESRRLLEKDPEQKGFQYVARRIRKKEETDSEEEFDDEEEKDRLKEPKNRLHSAATRQILNDAFGEAQYLSEESAKKLVRATKLTLQQVKAWFQNTRNKAWSQFRKGKIAELPGQMKVMDGMNKEREKRGEHLRMKEESEEDLENLENGEDQDDEEDVEDEKDADGGDEAVGDDQDVEDPFDITGYPVYPGMLS